MMPSTAALTWLGAGLALLVAELAAPGAFLMWIGLAALGTGAAVLAAGSIAAGLRVRRRPERRVNTPDAGLVGRTVHALAFDGREGRVRLGDSDWPAQLVSGAATPDPRGRLLVVGVKGLVLLVQPVERRGGA